MSNKPVKLGQLGFQLGKEIDPASIELCKDSKPPWTNCIPIDHMVSINRHNPD